MRSSLGPHIGILAAQISELLSDTAGRIVLIWGVILSHARN